MSVICKMFGHHLERVKIALRDPEEEKKINEAIKPVFCRRCKQAFSYAEYKKLRKG